MDKISKLQRNGLFHFHNGFYLTEDVLNNLRKVRNEHYDEIECEDDDAADYLYTNSEVFLHGSCNLLALALHEKFGYKVYEIRDNQERLFHVFCKATYRGQDVYIDVRGITTDFKECFSEFSNSLLSRLLCLSSCLRPESVKMQSMVTSPSFTSDTAHKSREFHKNFMVKNENCIETKHL